MKTHYIESAINAAMNGKSVLVRCMAIVQTCKWHAEKHGV